MILFEPFLSLSWLNSPQDRHLIPCSNLKRVKFSNKNIINAGRLHLVYGSISVLRQAWQAFGSASLLSCTLALWVCMPSGYVCPLGMYALWVLSYAEHPKVGTITNRYDYKDVGDGAMHDCRGAGVRPTQEIKPRTADSHSDSRPEGGRYKEVPNERYNQPLSLILIFILQPLPTNNQHHKKFGQCNKRNTK